MRVFALLSLLPLLQIAVATYGGRPPVYCGTTTVTRTHVETSITKAPTVTKTFTKDKRLCFATVTNTHTDTVTSKVKVTSTVVNHPTEYKTKWAPAVTKTKTKTVVKETCGPAQQHKRSFNDAESDVDTEDEEEIEFLTNAERLRRGLPLNKPVEKRTWPHGKPPGARPSCIPSTKVEWENSTKTKTVTPTQWTTTTHCRYTHTVDKVKYTTATVVKTKTLTKTVQGQPTTVKTTLTPTSTAYATSTKIKTTAPCHNTA